MITGMNRLIIIREDVNQAGKTTFLRVTQEVRPKLDISSIYDRIQHGCWAYFLSKNALFNKNPFTIVPVTRRNHS